MGKKKCPEGSSVPEYMATYGDLVTLLMCFFVLLFSMATIDKQKFIEIANSMRSSMTSISGGSALLSNQGQSIISISNNPSQTGKKSTDSEKYVEEAEEMTVDAEQVEEDRKLDVAKADLRSIVEEKGLEGQVEIEETKDWLLIRLESELFFDSGSAVVKDDGKVLLGEVSLVLSELGDKDILVQGHTDNIAIRTAQFQSNWELSTARATNVVKYIVDALKLDPARLTATGNAEFRPIADNATEEGRQKNRRIEIRVMK